MEAFLLKRATDTLTNVAFLAAIATPLALSAIRAPDAKPLEENRELAARPALEATAESYSGFPGDYEAYFNDHFGARNRLIRMHRWAMLGVLGVSPTDQVAVGKNGWLYLMSNYGADYQRSEPWTDKQLDEYVAHLEQRRQWLMSQKTRFLYVVAPAKNSIYPEYEPGAARNLSERTVLDQIYERLRKTEIDFIDLRRALIAAKNLGPLYSKTDTHWNELGQYVAAREILAHLHQYFPSVGPVPFEGYTQRIERGPGGDLAGLMAAQDIISEDWIRLRRTESIPVDGPMDVPGFSNEGLRRDIRFQSYESPGRRIRAVFMRDSFGNRLVPFLNEPFAQLVCAPYEPFYPALVNAVKPNIVIMEVNERYLLSPLADEAPEVRGAHIREPAPTDQSH